MKKSVIIGWSFIYYPLSLLPIRPSPLFILLTCVYKVLTSPLPQLTFSFTIKKNSLFYDKKKLYNNNNKKKKNIKIFTGILFYNTFHTLLFTCIQI